MRGLIRRTLRSMATLVVIGLLVAASLPSFASAQVDDGSFNLVTSPLPINLSAPPNTTLTTDIRVKNGSNHPERLKVSLMKFSAYGEEGKPGLSEREEGDDYFDWVTFTPSEFDAPPNEWVTIKMTIALPAEAAFGYYYAAVFSRASESVTPQDKQNVLVGSTAVLVLVEAQSPDAKREASIAEFTANRSFYEFLPTSFSVKIKNSGNVHLSPTGDIFISRGDKQVSTISVNRAAGNVLPDSNRIFTASWQDGFPVYIEKESGGKVELDEAGKPVQELRWELSKLSKLRFGHYTAKLLMVYDDGTKDVPLEATLSFWVIPWRIIGVGLVVLTLVGIGLWSILRNLYRKFRKKKTKNEKKTS